MKSVVIHGPKDLRLEDHQVAIPAQGQVQIQLAVGGICGSDLHYYNHGGFGDIRLKEPMVLGHEVSGHISQMGEGVTGFSLEQLVAVSPSRPCRDCQYCDEALFNHCLNMRFYGSAMPFPHIQGAFRQTLVVEASQCVVAEGLSAAEAAMAEPLAVCLHAVKNAGPLLGKSVLVTGCGPIGVLCILAARRAGADFIVATDLGEFTLEMARNAGADVAINMAQNSSDLARYTQGKGTFDVMFECSGAQVAVSGAVHAMRPCGTIIQLGLGGDMTLPVQAMTAKELSLRGSFRFHEEFPTGVSLMQKGLINVSPLITHSFGLGDLHRAFDTAVDRSRAMKVQLNFADA
ncbi:L-idonate 5-dehydrogenase [uncultured Litoreibacter sp.]|uniref:L-idonate 5-dehydrogenase n=1 Tax=uncultured Litoreibacter sp. TaxID=1392394 RepID=UPI0026033B2E|nr:L-idonate 5-dehydrogenase [uncultured Litoreibacter sp.]